MTNNSRACFTSHRPDWETPWELFNKINEEFDFTLDVCATEGNTKCQNFFTPEKNGLLQAWAPNRCWMNPPYGRGMSKWIWKAYHESLHGALVVGLIPSRTDTVWFHELIYGKAEIRFLRGRVRFVGSNGNAPFPSMLVIWKQKEFVNG